METRHAHEPHMPAGAAPQRGFVQTRLQNFGLTMTVMGASFILYYMGLFGSVEGPLTPARIGEELAAMGFSNRHLMIFLPACMAVALTWNWLYNGICLLLGRRMTCACRLEEKGGGFCGAPARKDNGRGYACSAGHRHPQANFHALKKGTLAHFMWMMFLIFSAMVLYLV